jgi:hypothetical protein
MQQYFLRFCSAKPSDIDAQAIAGRPACGQFQGMDLTASGLYLIEKFGSCFLVVLGKV